MTTPLTKAQLRILAALLMKPRTMDELYEHWPRARNPLRRLQRQGYVSLVGERWNITAKGEDFWNNQSLSR